MLSLSTTRFKTRKLWRLQSAMEFFMTYGWAILILAVALAILFELGVFNHGFSASTCIPIPGFICKNPIYAANAITFDLGQNTGRDYYGNWIFVVSQGEALNASGVPINFTGAPPAYAVQIGSGPDHVLIPGQITNVTFSYFPQGQILPGIPVGRNFAGYVWLGYCLSAPCSAPTAYEKVATMTLVSVGGYFGGGSGAPTPPHYVPIILTNTQTSRGTGPDFQQMIIVSKSYAANGEDTNLQNVEFSTDPGDAGGASTALYAWCESGCTSSSTSVWWVNMGADTMTANGIVGNTITIYMDFMPGNVMSPSGPTGEAPEEYNGGPNSDCSPNCAQTTYAQYDNGALVFPTFYDNFAGSYTYVNDSGIQTGTPPPGFFAVNAVVTVDNGLVLFNSTGATNGDGPLFATTSEYGVGTTFDADIVGLPSSDSVNIGYQELPYNPGPSPQYGTFIRQACVKTFPDQSNFTSDESNSCGGTYGSFFNSEFSPGVYSVTIVSSKESYQTYNYSASGTSQPIAGSFPEPPEIPGGYPTYVGFSASHGMTLPVQWVRIRKAPPSSSSGVPKMPQASFGSLQHA